MEYGLIGHPISHSFSPILHKKIGEFLKQPYSYEAVDILNEEELKKFLEKRNFKAINVTIPYKQKVIPYLDFIDEKASAIGAVNLILNDNGVLKGYNTDYDGLLSLVKSTNIDISKQNCLILGDGGTSKTAHKVLLDLGAKSIIHVSRHPSPEFSISYQEAIEKQANFNFILNTTPLGMGEKYDELLPIDITKFRNLAGVVDAVYTPLNTNLILQAKSLNIPAASGLKMLVGQGIKAAEIFLNRAIDPLTQEQIFKDILTEKTNIVLIGMPTSGKSTLGLYLSKITGRDFIDIDQEIEKKTGLSPEAYINKFGVNAFRDLEEEIIKDSSRKNHCIIATGGGSILRKINVTRLKRNGKIYFIDRPLELLFPSIDRPLSSDFSSLKKRYEERYDIYLASSDARIEANQSIEEEANCILEDLRK